MKFIQIAFVGKSSFGSYLITFALTFSTVLGVGILPYTWALKRAGLNVSQGISIQEAIEVLGKNSFLALQLAPFLLGLLVLMFCTKFIHKRPVLSLFTSRKKIDWKRVGIGFFSWGFLMFCLLGINYWIVENPYRLNFNSDTFVFLLVISLFLIPIQTTFEEAFFRGNLLQGFGRFFKKGWISIFFTASLFALVHGANPEVKTLGIGILIYFLVTGIFLGIITVMDDGLELSIGFHAWNNIFGALIVTNDWQSFQSDAIWMDLAKPNFGWDSLVTMIVCFPLMTFFFAKIFNWKNWKNNLFDTINFRNIENDKIK